MSRSVRIACLVAAACLTRSAMWAHAQEASSAPPANELHYSELPTLVFRAINTNEEASIRLYRDDGSLDPAALDPLAHLLRDLATGEPSPVVARTVELLVRIATRFHADHIDVISGFRSGRNSAGHRVRREGYHSVGSAIDFAIPGVEMAVVAAYARTFSHVGVGWYPTTGFVHLDSREQTFFWENRSGHGHHGWDRPLDRTGVAERDAGWTPARDEPWESPRASTVLVVHPRTEAGARRPRHARRERHASRSTHQRAPLRVFRGAPETPSRSE